MGSGRGGSAEAGEGGGEAPAEAGEGGGEGPVEAGEGGAGPWVACASEVRGRIRAWVQRCVGTAHGLAELLKGQGWGLAGALLEGLGARVAEGSDRSGRGGGVATEALRDLSWEQLHTGEVAGVVPSDTHG